MRQFEYDHIDAMWTDAVRYLLKHGSFVDSRDGSSLEGIGFSGILTEPDQSFLFNPVRNLSPIYANAELLWYMLGTTSIGMIRMYAPQYERFSEDGQAFGAYGSRWVDDASFKRATLYAEDHQLNGGRKSQIQAVINLLKLKPNTRQAVVVMWNGGDLVHAIVGDHKDLPCTLSLQFILRNNKLCLITTMRSNDVWLGMPYDIYCFTCLQRLVADELGVEVGQYVHNVGSIHLYQRNVDKARRAVECSYHSHRHVWKSIAPGSLKFSVQTAVHIEIALRKLDGHPDANVSGFTAELPPGSLLQDAVTCCAARWHSVNPTLLQSRALKEALTYDRNRRS